MYVSKYNEIPYEIKEKLRNTNIYYDSKYAEYERLNNKSVWYLYNDFYIQVVLVQRIKKIFSVATLVSEPYQFSDSKFNKIKLENFLNDVLDTLKKQLRVDWINSTLAGADFKAYPENSQRIRWGNYIIYLSGKTLEEVFYGFDSKHRNMVRRGERSNLTIKFGGKDLLDDYLKLDEQTWKRSNKIINNSLQYQRFIEGLGDSSIVAIAYNSENIPQCGLVGVYNKAMFYYMYGASADHPEPGSTHYLQYQTIKLMIEKGVKAYNFVGCRISVNKGSKYERIQHFKKGFGGDLVECYMFKSVLNNFKYQLFRFLCFLKGKKINNDAIDDEIYKWTDIN